MRIWIAILLIALAGCASEPKVEKPSRLQLAESALRAGNRAFAAERYQDAAMSWQDAMDAYRSIDDWAGQGEARLGLALAFSRQNETAAARNVLLGLPEQQLFPQPLRARAAYQLALLAARDNAAEAGDRLTQARTLCAAPCALTPQLDNLQARLALPADPARAETLVRGVLDGMPDAPPLERAHAWRLLAEARLLAGDAAGARDALLQAVAIDRERANSVYLGDDFALLVKVARALGDATLLAEAEARFASLCAATRVPACKAP
ncbi:hypothetical protein [Chitiniphilus shinanonensis]|uniref:hypothetical protein n=1 Tax=Chitiniphilus shinanonensis TaxID=553088 RepID=UPI0030589272